MHVVGCQKQAIELAGFTHRQLIKILLPGRWQKNAFKFYHLVLRWLKLNPTNVLFV